MPPRLTNREKALRTISEARFQKDVENMLDLFGWRFYHAPANKPVNGHVQNIRAGFPDIVAARGTRLIFAELKTQTGRIGPGQMEWLEAIRNAGAETYLWRPGDMMDIHATLSSP